MFDVAVIGGGIGGMATAARLQARGLTTAVFEAHGRVGGCAGYFRQRGFSFDVGATTLVDFEAGGVGGELLENIGMSPLEGEALPGYVAWLPDRTVTLHRAPVLWRQERLAKLGDTPQHRGLWALFDQLAEVFWAASRKGIKLPLQSISDVLNSLRCIGLSHLSLTRYLLFSMGEILNTFNLRDDRALCGLLGMLVEDTVHSSLDRAPLLNAALGITIRGAGLMRHSGGMYGFWKRFMEHYRGMGGVLHVGCKIERVHKSHEGFRLLTARGAFEARQVVSALPIEITLTIAPDITGKALRPFLQRDAEAMGGAVVVFLGVPEDEVEGQTFTHHQLLQDYDAPLGDGNNMFVSVSAPDDILSAPPGYRAVMLSTHCNLADWERVSAADYAAYKQAYGDCLIQYARRVYPHLGSQPAVYEIGTPRTYQHFTGRPRGAVGGVMQNLRNANQFAVPHDIGARGFWLAGDGTWPGLGTVACVLGSRIVAEGVERLHRKKNT
jgi:C-3',4' desaturase CrtD